jgi:3-oxoacyl-[acyl-carrier protein] reductase
VSVFDVTAIFSKDYSFIMMNQNVALITGASRGIGAATAKLLASRGMRIVVNYNSSAELAEEVARSIHKAGGEAIAISADVREAEQVERMVAEAQSVFGSVDILVSNAAMSFAQKPIQEMQWEEFSQKLNDDMRATFNVTKSVVPIMVKNGHGRIVYVSTGLARHPQIGFAAHGSAKAAIGQFARYVAQEFGPAGITANVIAPGFVTTERTTRQPQALRDLLVANTPLGHLATAEDIANAIAAYVSEETRFITGSYISVDGGMTMD